MDFRTRLVIYIASILLFVLTLVTIKRNYVWWTERTLWQDVVDKSPRLPAGHLNLARDYHLTGNSKVAIAEYQKAMRLAADRLNQDGSDFRARDILATAQTDLAALMLEAGDPADSETALVGALRLIPHFGPAEIMLGQLYLQQRRYMNVISLTDDALEAHSWGAGFTQESQFYINKALALCGIGNREMSNRAFDHAAAIDPDIKPGVCR